MWRRQLSDDKIEGIVRSALDASGRKRREEAWSLARPLRAVHEANAYAGLALIHLIREGAFERRRSAELAAALLAAHSGDLRLVGKLGSALDSVYERRYLNAEPPREPVFRTVAEQLLEAVDEPVDAETRGSILNGLATAARVLGRTWDEVAEKAALGVVELDPACWESHYDLALFYKTRGRFAEGQRANQAARELGGAEDEAVLWNLGICATGAGDAETALEVWRGIGQTLEIGRFELPDGAYAPVKVRLAQRPLAERRPPGEADDPGEEETVWIERLSPCHGIVRSAGFHEEIAVDHGDVVLFDGAPVTYHTYDDRQVPVFPHLVTLLRNHYRIFPFGGTQRRQGQIAELSDALPEEVVLYVITEQVRVLCRSCWDDPGVDHAEHGLADHRVVTGRLCAPPSSEPARLLELLDEALHGAAGARLFAPELSRAAGDRRRAEVEELRLRMIAGA